MIKHRRCDKHVRDRVSDTRDLWDTANDVSEISHLAYLMALQFGQFPVPLLALLLHR